MKTRFAKLIAALAFAGVGFASQACVIRETGVNRGYGYGYAQAGYHGGAGVYVGDPNPYYTSSMPPEPLYESMSTSPGYGYVWIDGYWNWNGYEWVWVSGSWNRDQSGYVYVQPYYDYQSDYGYVYYPGHWSRPDRVPDRVKIVDHRDGRPRTGYQPPRHTSGGDRDHRDDGGGDYTPPPRDRDHRDTDSGTTRNPPRDHRGDDGGTTTPPPRDHRDPKTTGKPPRDRMPANDKSPGTRTPPKTHTKQPARVPTTGDKVRDKAPTRTKPNQPTRAPNTGTKVRDKPSKPAPRGRDHRSSMIEATENRRSLSLASGRAVAMTSGRETGLKTARSMSLTSARRR